MVKKRKIKEEEDYRKEIIAIKIQTTQAARGRTRKRSEMVGVLFTMADVIASRLQSYDRVYRNNDDKEIIVEGSSLSDVKNVLVSVARSHSKGGHGGDPLSFKPERRIIDPLESEKNIIRLEYQDRLFHLEKKVEKLEEELEQSRSRQ